MLNLDKYFEKATTRNYTKEEVETLVKALKNGEIENTYDAIYLIGCSNHIVYESLIVDYLLNSNDDIIIEIALKVLCDHWGMTKKYLNVVKKYLKGNEIDITDHIRLSMISIVGEYLNAVNDKELLGYLYKYYKDESEKVVIREAAYIALGRLYGKSYKELPIAKHKIDFEKDIDKNVIKWVEKLLK